MKEFDQFVPALPDVKTATALYELNYNYLVACLDHVADELSNFLQAEDICILRRHIDDLRKQPRLLSIFTLWNSQLIDCIDRGDQAHLTNLIRSFSYVPGIFMPPEKHFHHEITTFSFDQIQLNAELQAACVYNFSSELPYEVNLSSSKPEQLYKFEQTLAETMKAIQQVSQEFYGDTQAYVKSILVMKSDQFKAGSSFNMLGMIGMRDDLTVDLMVDFLIHEAAHQYLHHLMAHDELVSGEGKYVAVLRKEPRPLEGIYHAYFVLARLIYFFRQSLHVKSGLTPGFAQQKIDEYIPKFQSGYEVLNQNAHFTEFGRKIFDVAKDLVFAKKFGAA